jgi:predicted transposase YbfD/YdcC
VEHTAAVNAPQVLSFLEGLRLHLPDRRDNRGKRHSHEFTLVSIVIALLAQCQTLSSVHRFMGFRLEWLRELTGMLDARALSRAYLPRFLDRIDWVGLNGLVGAHFQGALLPGTWVAIDGKVLRGSTSSDESVRETVVLAVAHGSGLDVARATQSGPKSSEVVAVRKLLQDSGLASHKVTLDALHCNPETLSIIATAAGEYVTSVKGNQPELLALCGAIAAREPAQARLREVDKGHGRVSSRSYQLLPLRGSALDKRWACCEPRYLVTVMREVYTCKTQATARELSYYITNATGPASATCRLAELAHAIQGHWAVESNNWVRDVVLKEDQVRISAPQQAQVMALLRSLALNLLRQAGGHSLQAQMEQLCHVPSVFAAWLKQRLVL